MSVENLEFCLILRNKTMGLLDSLVDCVLLLVLKIYSTKKRKENLCYMH